MFLKKNLDKINLIEKYSIKFVEDSNEKTIIHIYYIKEDIEIVELILTEYFEYDNIYYNWLTISVDGIIYLNRNYTSKIETILDKIYIRNNDIEIIEKINYWLYNKDNIKWYYKEDCEIIDSYNINEIFDLIQKLNQKIISLEKDIESFKKYISDDIRNISNKY